MNDCLFWCKLNSFNSRTYSSIPCTMLRCSDNYCNRCYDCISNGWNTIFHSLWKLTKQTQSQYCLFVSDTNKCQTVYHLHNDQLILLDSSALLISYLIFTNWSVVECYLCCIIDWLVSGIQLRKLFNKQLPRRRDPLHSH